MNPDNTSPIIDYKERTTNINSYTSKGLIGKSNFVNSTGTANVNHFLLSLPNSNLYQGSFTISLIARYASLPLQSANGFFCIGASSGSFQIDNTGSNFSIRVTQASGSSTVNHTILTDVPLDTKFHNFIIVKDTSISQGTSGRLKIYIDGEQVNVGAGEDAYELNLFGAVRLLSNRSNNRRVDGEIAYFGLEPIAKTEKEVADFSGIGNCLFEEY